MKIEGNTCCLFQSLKGKVRQVLMAEIYVTVHYMWQKGINHNDDSRKKAITFIFRNQKIYYDEDGT